MNEHWACLQGKTALVTGSSRGIGKACAKTLARMGANIIINYHNSGEEAAKLASEIERLDSTAQTIRADVSSAEQVNAMFQEIADKYDTLDILINNAGVGAMNYVCYMTEQQWDSVINTNLKSAFLCSKHALKRMMRQRSGCIVNISSIAALHASVRQANYAASKAGLIALTQSAAKEVGGFGIRVNAVAPGAVYTDMNRMTEEEEAKVKKLTPLQRIARPDDIAQVVAFLCSPMATHVTGQMIRVDGGFTL